MALYSDLVLKLSATLAEDGSSVLIEDATGTFPESPGGYAPEGSGTLQRPSESEVAKFLMYRVAPFAVETENIPTVATPPPATFSLLGPDGLPVADAVYQFVFMVDSIDGDTWDFLYTEASESGDPWGYLVSYFSDDESGNAVQIGQLGVWANVAESNCFNEARERAMNAFVTNGGCDSSEVEIKNFWMQAITSNVDLAQSYPIDSQTSNDFYLEASEEIAVLTEICNSESCKCNC
jgi:hypothetical protein